MSLKKLKSLQPFLSQCFADADPDQDSQNAAQYAAGCPRDRQEQILIEAKDWLKQSPLPLEDLGIETNRWFGDENEARDWFKLVLSPFESATSGDVVVKDSNGTPLAEGDSVQVIKDLKVKGGSSDLKRGTLIKKIHLVGDPEVIECRVDGSTLVLKTCFLKKA